MQFDWPGKEFKMEVPRKVDYFIHNILETHEQHGGKRKIDDQSHKRFQNKEESTSEDSR